MDLINHSSRRSAPGLIVVLVTMLGIAMPSSYAAVFMRSNDSTGSTLEVDALTTIADDTYIFASGLQMEGIIDGDLSAMAADIRVGGTVTQAANIFTQSYRQTGVIQRGLRLFSDNASITGVVDGSLLGVVNTLTFEPGSVIQGDSYVVTARLVAEGTIKENLWVVAENASVFGHVGGSLTFRGDRLEIGPEAVIIGNIEYRTDNENALVVDSSATILGSVLWQPPVIDTEGNGGFWSAVLIRVSGLLAAFLFGLLLIAILPRPIDHALRSLSTRAAASFAAGLVTAVSVIVLAVLFLLALVMAITGSAILDGNLAAVGALLLVIGTLLIPIASFGTVVGSILLYSGAIVVGMWGGRRMMRRETVSRFGMFVALAALTALFAIPYVGIVLAIIVSLFGAGAFLLGLRQSRRDYTSNDSTPSGDVPAVT